MSASTIIRSVLRALLHLHLAVARFLDLPAGYWIALGVTARRMGLGADSLVPQRLNLDVRRAGPRAAGLQPPVVLGRWTLDADALRVLETCLERVRPGTIIECGAGVSTIVLATYCRAAAVTPSPLVPHTYSLEQDLDHAARTRRALARRGLSGFATVLHAPLSRLGGTATPCYDIEASGLRAQIADRRVDLVLIDGPAGPDAARLETLPSIAGFCRDRATWLLDDALRLGELVVLSEWLRRGLISDLRLLPIGKGLAVGLLNRSGSRDTSNDAFL